LKASHKTNIILELRTIHLIYLSCSFSVLKNGKSQRTPAQPSGVALWCAIGVNVYVVLLEPAVGKIRKVRAENPQRNPKKPCIYVGMTRLFM